MSDQQAVKSAPNPCRVLLPNVRLAFTSLFKKKRRALNSDQMTFQTVVLIPPTVDTRPLTVAIKAAMLKKFQKEIPLKEKGNPIHRCNGEYSGYVPGWFHLNLHSERQPPVVNLQRIPITDPTEVWSGQWANVVITSYGWGPNAGGSGVSFQLDAVQILRDGADTDPDGARLDGRGRAVNPDEVFEALEMPAGEADSGFDPFAGMK